MKIRSINNFEREERRKLTDKLMKLKENLEKQNKLLFNLFCSPNQNMIDAINRFLLNPPYRTNRHKQIGIKQLMFIIDRANKQKEKVKKLLKLKSSDENNRDERRLSF